MNAEKYIEQLADEAKKLCDVLKARQNLKSGLYEEDIRKILEDKILKHFDAYKFSDIFDVLAYKREWPYGHVLIGFEIKSDRDKPIRIFEQLPQYLYICDAVYLVLGEKVNIPPNLPSWVGVLKIVGNDIKVIKHGGARIDLLMEKGYISLRFTGVDKRTGCSLLGKRMHYMSKEVLPNYRKYGKYLPVPEFFYNFLKKWFVLSLFRDRADELGVEFDTAEIVMLEALANYFRYGTKQKSLVEFGEGD